MCYPPDPKVNEMTRVQIVKLEKEQKETQQKIERVRSAIERLEGKLRALENQTGQTSNQDGSALYSLNSSALSLSRREENYGPNLSQLYLRSAQLQ